MEIVIGDQEADQRFDRFLRKYFKPHTDVKLSDIYAWIRHGDIKVNGRKTKEKKRLQAGDTISRKEETVSLSSPQDAIASKSTKVASRSVKNIKKMIIYEDDHRIRWNKPADMVTHPGNKHTTDVSLHDIMQSYLKQTEQKPDSPTFNPSFCFRLDKDTSGVIISAKTYEGLQLLNKLIRERQPSKKYLAIVEGKPKDSGTIDAPLFVGYDKKSGRSKSFINQEKGKESQTDRKKILTVQDQALGDISLVEVTIHSGRMHQIRVHMASIGHPVIGDITYGNNALNRICSKEYGITRQLLHSRSYGFMDTLQDTYLRFQADVPEEFIRLFPSYIGL